MLSLHRPQFLTFFLNLWFYLHVSQKKEKQKNEKRNTNLLGVKNQDWMDHQLVSKIRAKLDKEITKRLLKERE